MVELNIGKNAKYIGEWRAAIAVTKLLRGGVM